MGAHQTADRAITGLIRPDSGTVPLFGADISERLDIEGTVMFRRLVQRCAEERGTTFPISSHMIHELEQLCSRVGIIFAGMLHTEGRVSELLAHNQSLEQLYIGELHKAKGEALHA